MGPVDSLYHSDWNNFAPRIGFAWDVGGDSKTALRGGYGVSYDKLFFNVGSNSRFNPPFFGIAELSPFFGDRVEFFLGNDPASIFGGFPGIVVPGADLGLDELGGILGSLISLGVLDSNPRDSYVHNLFLGVQRSLGWAAVFEINYQSTLGKKLPFIGDPNRFSGDLTGRADPLGRSAGDARENRLNPSFASFNLCQNRITSNYHGVNTQLTKRFSDGVTFQVCYTFGKSLDYNSDVFGWGNAPNPGGSDIYFADPLDIRLGYGRSIFDIRQRFVANFLWEIPAFRQQQGFFGKVLGGWQMNTIVPIQSGLPFTIIKTASFPFGDYNADGTEYDRPDESRLGNQFRRRPDTKTWVDGVFTRADFPLPEVGSNGTLGKNTFTGPAFWTTDFPLFKDFKVPISEEARFQFQAEFFNLFNRVNVFLPNLDLGGIDFGRSTGSFDAREIQFPLKILF